jgi:putative transferase (TIGR04331 family)
MADGYYLVTTGDIYNKYNDNHLLFLGPWCLLGNNKDYLAKAKYSLLASPFKPATKIKEAADYCWTLYEFLMPQIKKEMNKLHNVNYPERYWRILLGPWVYHFIGIFYDRYRRIEVALNRYPDFITDILQVEQCKPVTANTIDFINQASEDNYYNLQLFSIICRHLCFGGCRELKLDLPEKHLTSYVQQGITSRLWSWFENEIYSDSRPILLSEMYHITPIDKITMRLDKRFKFVGFKSFKLPDIEDIKSINYSLRNNLKFFHIGDDFSSLLANVLPLAIPLCYIEQFSVFTEKANNDMHSGIKFFGSAVGWYFNENLKYYTAEAVLNGAGLLDFQHGGAYGSSWVVPPEDLSLEKNVFFTWGWDWGGKGNTIPLPNPHLSRLKNRYHTGNKKSILMVGTAMPPYHYRFDAGIKTDDMFSYLDNKSKFITVLKDDIKQQLEYRPYKDYGWNEISYIKTIYSGVSIASEGRLIDYMKKARIVVIDHAQTGFLEALTLNVPTVLYWDHDIYVMRPEAEPYFQQLRDVGILYKDPENAARKVNEIYDDPMKWWQSRAVQEAKNNFCQKFALSSNNWKKDWAEVLANIVEQNG